MRTVQICYAVSKQVLLMTQRAHVLPVHTVKTRNDDESVHLPNLSELSFLGLTSLYHHRDRSGRGIRQIPHAMTVYDVTLAGT